MGQLFSIYTFALHRATSKGSLVDVKSIIDSGVDVDQTNRQGQTALHIAASQGYLHLIRFLLTNGCDLHFQDENGSTALHLATDFGHIEIVDFLLFKGACVQKQDNKGYTPLHWACIHGHVDIAVLLLGYGAPINAKDNYLWTPLHWVCYHAYLDFIDVLFENGANFDAKDIDGWFPGERFSRWVEEKEKVAVQSKLNKLIHPQIETEQTAEITQAKKRGSTCVNQKVRSPRKTTQKKKHSDKIRKRKVPKLKMESPFELQLNKQIILEGKGYPNYRAHKPPIPYGNLRESNGKDICPNSPMSDRTLLDKNKPIIQQKRLRLPSRKWHAYRLTDKEKNTADLKGNARSYTP
mmetsp:Transcript_31715/g.40684  ORF Transcript_31715/g.40684 Transcript_31715/m.40684 type:complete len:351 (+) Transcript_31715:58-1110(+)